MLHVQQVIIPFLAYMIPAFYLFYMALDIISRNPRKTEHRLVSLMIFSYFLLLVEEYLRHLLPLEYSPVLVNGWFGNVGVIIPALGFHFIAAITDLHKKMPRHLYPYIFYLPLVFILLNAATETTMFTSREFVQMGIWKVPEYNTAYYTTVTFGNIIIMVYMMILAFYLQKELNRERKRLYKTLLLTMGLMLVWTSVFGYIPFGSGLPPHPFIYAGIIWGFALRLAMNRHNFLTTFKSRYETLFNLNPLAILLVNRTGLIIDSNPGAKKMLYLEENHDTNISEFIHPGVMKKWEQAFESGLNDQLKIKGLETRFMINDEKKDVVIEGDYLLVDEHPHYILILRDVTGDMEKSRRISFLAYHDYLTGLSNRRYFYKRFEERVKEWKKNHEQSLLALVLIDLDHFKHVNDQYGHTVGDQFLKHVAYLLKESMLDQGVAARLGGDEFVLFLENVSSMDAIKEYMSELYQTINKNPFVSGNIHIPVNMSIGVSICPSHGETCDELLRYADQSMYNIKKSSGNDFEIFPGKQDTT